MKITPSMYPDARSFVKDWEKVTRGEEASPPILTLDGIDAAFSNGVYKGGDYDHILSYVPNVSLMRRHRSDFIRRGILDKRTLDKLRHYSPNEDFYEDERGVRALLSEAFNREYLDLVVNSGLVYGPINNYEARFSDRFYRVLSPFFKEGSRGIVESFRRCAKACLDPYSALRERSCYCNSDHDDHTIEIGIMLVSAGIGTTFYTTFPYVSNPLYQLSQDASFVSVMVYSLARWTYDTGAFGTSDPFDHEYIKWFDQSIICVS